MASGHARWPRASKSIRLLALLLVASMAVGVLCRATTRAQEPVPLLAYYYIWFDEQSWDRAKTDYPLLGRYSSDDTEVMRQHVAWAQQAGIAGFIVSWKSTEKLNRRLKRLTDIASSQGFALSLIYQGLDFDREPLAIERVAQDLEWFGEHYADQEPFLLFDRPLVIWSGTWEYTPEQVASVTDRLRERMLILASERNVDGYLRLADSVNGNAYYWSSVDPSETAGYVDKLSAMGEVIHARGGIWIAPAAPGYDARPLGGTRVVQRRDGETLRKQMGAAKQSAPDAIGLISWNEFSENTHIEPSEDFGIRYLDLLTTIDDELVPVPITFGSDLLTDNSAEGAGSSLLALGMLATVMVASLVVIAVRRPAAGPGNLDSASNE